MNGKNELRVLQLIDSLDAGGAERMSVNLANALHRAGISSHLCSTRRGGPMAEALDPEVPLLILEKRSALDPAALRRLVRYVRENRIGIIHAHSTAYFSAVLCRLFVPVRIVWHNHSGEIDKSPWLPRRMVRWASFFFDYALTVNEKLLVWTRGHLSGLDRERIGFLPNFAVFRPTDRSPELPGTPDRRIVHLANLREQKDHGTMLRAFRRVLEEVPEWHLLLVGNDRGDTYSRSLREYVRRHGMGERVHFLGARSDSADILAASTIGVLSSRSEGLPVALLEYGLAGLPVVCTDVGQCAKVLGEGEYGLIVPPGDPSALAEALGSLMEAPQRRRKLGDAFRRQVEERYSEKAVVKRLLELYREVLT